MTTQPKFLRRFDQLWSALRRHQFRLGVGATIAVAAVGFGLLAWGDHRWELPRSARALGLATVAVAAIAALRRWVDSPLRWWTRPRTAVEIEGRFPQLGQRIRTVVQYAGLEDEAIDSEGVTPGLVGALNEETEARVEPLPLHSIVPRWPVTAIAMLALAPIVLLGVAAMRDPEWRIAVQRSVLVERPYTTLSVLPGNVLVDQGEDVEIVAEVKGRMRPKIMLESRRADRPGFAWKATRFRAPERGPQARCEMTLEQVKDPLEYRVVAGPARSVPFKISVRYPLEIKDFTVTLSPPSYTGLGPSKVKGGDMQAVEGTDAVLSIEFDTPPAEAVLELSDPSRNSTGKDRSPATPTIVPLRREGEGFVAEMKLMEDRDYKVVAKSADRGPLPRNKYRIDVRQDRAPRVAFEEPEEALEVHPVAEVMKRVRVGDDFGVTKAGIVFRFNDGEEKALTFRDLTAEEGGKPQTSATLEETLLMETLVATPQDSVTYYAFAEDNFPGRPRRTETDLRYIDIRPFKRDYRLADPAGGFPGEPDELATLEELIARQRFNLNRAHRLARHRPTDRADSEDPLKIAGFEETLLSMTREFAEGIEGIVDAPVEPLHRAEEAMLAAVEALDRSRNSEAPPAMSEALKNLVAARREIFFIIGQNPAAAMAMRSFDRKQAQKIRKPKGKDEEAEQLAAEIEELAQDEDIVYATIAAAMDPGEVPKGEEGEREDEPKDAERKGSGGPGQGDEGERGSGEPKKVDRRAIAEKQEEITDEVRALEERLKRIEAASDLAKARMARAAEEVEKASGALARGNSKEASEEAKAGAGMLHELARQVKGEIAREVADQIAMARDLAEELAGREADLAERNETQGPPGDQPGKGKGRRRGDQGGDLTEAERIESMAEAARTLEAWLKQIDQQGQGRSADAVREILEQGTLAEIVERTERMGELRIGGKPLELGREARELSGKFERIGQALELLHRVIVAPQLAAMVEFDRRVAELTARLATLKTDAEITAWHRDASALIRDLENAGIAGATELSVALKDGGWTGGGVAWQWGDRGNHRLAPTAYANALRTVSTQIKDRIQEMVLKDVASARDEAIPPKYREMVERYYEVLSRGGK